MVEDLDDRIPARRSDFSPAAKALEPLAASLWILFLIWTAVIAAVWLLGFGEAELRGWFSVQDQATGEKTLRFADLFQALRAVVALSDAIWIGLAVGVAYLATAAKDGLAFTRKAFLLIAGSSWFVGALSVWTNFPLGSLRFTERLGFKLGPVSLGWVLLWFCVVVGLREFVNAVAKRSSHSITAVIAGALGGAVSVLIELVGWKARAWWLWYPGKVPAPAMPPVSTYLTWAVLTGCLAFLLRDQEVVRSRPPEIGRATLVLGILLALLATTLRTAIW